MVESPSPQPRRDARAVAGGAVGSEPPGTRTLTSSRPTRQGRRGIRRPAGGRSLGRRIAAALCLLFVAVTAKVHAFPTIDNFFPQSGGPGTLVTILGSGFADTEYVYFDTALANFTIQDDGTLSAVVPTNATTGAISVYTATGVAADYVVTFIVPPRVSGFTPTFGTVGDSVTVNGVNFIPGQTVVFFNGVLATNTVTGATQLQALVPPEARSGPIAVGTYVGTNASTASFTVIGPGPYITSFSPPSGAPGNQVVLTGVRFTGATNVSFNGTSATFAVTADTQILATVPTNASTGPLSVGTPLGSDFTESHFLVLAGPILSSFDPPRGPVGTLVTLFGRNFLTNLVVQFGGVSAVVQYVGDTELQATVPTGAITGPITVADPWGTNSSTTNFFVTVGPTITSFSPTSAPVGAPVTISGDHFTGATQVTLGGQAAVFDVVADTQIHTSVPAGATNAPVTVSTPEGTGVSTNLFVVLPPGPVINGFSPGAGGPGTNITILGAYFTSATGVQFNGVAADYQVTADTQIQAQVPPGATTGPLAVITPSGTNISSTNFFVPAQILGFDPLGGAPGTAVVITGANFVGATAITFNGVGADFTFNASTQLTAVVPPAAASGPVTVVTPAGTTISQGAFTVPVSIGGFSPLAGPAGTVVTIVGTTFSGASAVLFNQTPAAGFSVDSPSQLRAVVPASARSGPITVLTPLGSASSGAAFLVAVSGDLAVGVTDQPGPALVGNPLTYTITVTNLGPSSVTGLTVTNWLSAGTPFVSATASQGSSAATNGAVVFSLGSLTNSQVAQCSVQVLARSVGLFTNTVFAAANELDPNLGNNLAQVVTAVQGLFNLNLVRNGDAEAGPGSAAGADVLAVPGWLTSGNFTVVQYGASLDTTFPKLTSAGPADRGQNFFAGGPANTNSSAVQALDLGAGFSQIAAGGVTYQLAGYLGGANNRSDNATFQATFLDAASAVLGVAVLGPVTATDRTNTTALLPRAAQGPLPLLTRRVELRLVMNGTAGPQNTAFADNLSFQLTAAATPVLTIVRLGGNVYLSWPAAATNFVLQQATQLAPRAWTNVAIVPIVSSNSFQVGDFTTDPVRFYRLSAP